MARFGSKVVSSLQEVDKILKYLQGKTTYGTAVVATVFTVLVFFTELGTIDSKYLVAGSSALTAFGLWRSRAGAKRDVNKLSAEVNGGQGK